MPISAVAAGVSSMMERVRMPSARALRRGGGNMKIRDSGMPDPQTWESFFEPSRVLRQLGFSSRTEDAVDLGCGYGTFSIPAAQLTSGTVHAFDIDREMIAATDTKARSLGLSNVMAVERDCMAEGTGLLEGSVG